MSSRSSSRSLPATIAFAVFAFALCVQAQTETVLHAFGNGPGGFQPEGDLISDPAGNLYGVTYGGGSYSSTCGTLGCGIVYELSRATGGSWKETVLIAFTGVSGSTPNEALVRDAAGNLYGTTLFGGDFNSGVAFELSPTSTGSWKETVLHAFSGGADGYLPSGPLTPDAAGNLYGATAEGGSTACTYGCGTIFRLSPTSNGAWTKKLLYTFPGGQVAYPGGGLVLDAAGNLYGVTSSEFGSNTRGTVFKLSPTSSGLWNATILHVFVGEIGSFPNGVILDQTGNLYGTTYGVSNVDHCLGGCGTVFELSPNSDGTWTEVVLHRFIGGPGGAFPSSGLIFDSGGSLYGTTFSGGTNDAGTVFKLVPLNGIWTLDVIYSFTGGAYGGSSPYWGLIRDGSGDLFGVAGGGAGGHGIAYEITP